MRYQVGSVELDVLEAGDPDAPAILLLHGFPESSHSWRHQLAPLAAAGFHVLAPDQRGYAGSSAPRDVDAYGTDSLSADAVGLLDATGHDDAIVVGHDWGALLLWDLCRLHPDRVRAAVGVSVPYTPWPAPPTEVFRWLHGDNFFYILYFQQVGPPEAELEADVEATMRGFLWRASGDGFPTTPPAPIPAEGNGVLDSLRATGPIPTELPGWLTADDLAIYVAQFEQSGFFGPVSWYRNLDADYERTKDLAFPNIPTGFIAGTKDLVIAGRDGMVESMEAALPDHRRSILLDGIGHWTQQEDPNGFNAALLTVLRDLDPVHAGWR